MPGKHLMLACLALSMPWQAAIADVGSAKPLRVLLDVRTTHSDGTYTMEELTTMAMRRGIKAVAFCEHDRFSIRFGLEPFPRLLGYEIQHPSLYVTGLGSFFSDLERIRRRHPDMIFLAGTESIPGYFWKGIPFYNLSLHNADRHIIALGVEKPEQIRALPSYTLRHIHGPVLFSMLVWCILAAGVVLLLLAWRLRLVAALVAAIVAVFLAGWQQRLEVDPDAAFIATARQEGLFVIWAHPGTLSGERIGPLGIRLDTPPYSRRVFKDPTADAFAAIYGDSDGNTLPGGLWDHYLTDYMHGYHPAPIWAVAAPDFHGRSGTGKYLGDSPMDVWVRHASAAAVMTALRQGRMVAWHLPKNANLRVGDLHLESGHGLRFLPGGEGSVRGPLRLVFSLQGHLGDHGSASPLQAQIIVDGVVIAHPTVMPSQPQTRILQLAPGPHVIRIRIPDQHGVRMVANPFLIRIRP